MKKFRKQIMCLALSLCMVLSLGVAVQVAADVPRVVLARPLFTLSRINNRNILININEVPYATGYQIQRRRAGVAAWTQLFYDDPEVTNGEVTSLSIVDTGVTYGIYQFRVRAVHRDGAQVVTSMWSAVRSIRISACVDGHDWVWVFNGYECWLQCSRSDCLIIDKDTVSEHYWSPIAAVAPNCISPGREEGRHCTRCNIMTVGEVVSALGHRPGDSVVTTAPSCVTPGIKLTRCVDCPVLLDVDIIPAHNPEHIPGTPVVAIQATCVTPGITLTHCSDCDTLISSNIIAPINHQLATVPAIAASCVRSGRTAGQRCTRAGCNFTTGGAVVEPQGHTRVSRNARNATFFAAGRTADIVCGRANCNVVHQSGTAIARRTLGAPRVTLRARGGRRISVTSSAVASANRYQFQFRRQGQRSWRNGGTVSGRNRNIAGLTGGRNYEVRVRAARVEGRNRANSGWSAVARVRVR